MPSEASRQANRSFQCGWGFRQRPTKAEAWEAIKAILAWASDLVDPSWKYLYVMGGRDASGTALSSIERLPLQVQPDEVALKVEAGGTLGEAAGDRWEVDTMQPFKAGYASTESYSIQLCPVLGPAPTRFPIRPIWPTGKTWASISPCRAT